MVQPAPVIPNDRNARNGKAKPTRLCPACSEMHTQGSCSLKVAKKEICPLCGLAHYGPDRICPHIKSETQLNAMINALRQSIESKSLVDAAAKYLRDVRGTLVQRRKQKEKKANANANGASDVGERAA